MLFLYTVGKMEPKSAGGLLDDSPNPILHRSKMISSESDWYGLGAGAPREAASDSCTSQRFPFSSRITRLWLFVRPFVSKKVSMMRGGGRLSEASHVLHVRSGSRRTSVSSTSTLNCTEEPDSASSPMVWKRECRLDECDRGHTQRFTLGVSDPLMKEGGSSTRECKMIKAAFV